MHSSRLTMFIYMTWLHNELPATCIILSIFNARQTSRVYPFFCMRGVPFSADGVPVSVTCTQRHTTMLPTIGTSGTTGSFGTSGTTGNSGTTGRPAPTTPQCQTSSSTDGGNVNVWGFNKISFSVLKGPQFHSFMYTHFHQP